MTTATFCQEDSSKFDQPSLIQSTASLYEDFVNTFERSPISHQRCTPCNSNVIQQVHIEEGDDEDSSLRFHTPFSQQRQTFNLSESLSPLLLDRISVHQRQEHGVIDQAPISESQPLSLPNTQNHESQVLQALNPNLNQPQNQNFQNTNQSSAKGDERFCSYDSDNAKGDERFYSYDSNNSMYKMFDGDDKFEQNEEQPQLSVQITNPNIGESDDDVGDC